MNEAPASDPTVQSDTRAFVHVTPSASAPASTASPTGTGSFRHAQATQSRTACDPCRQRKIKCDKGSPCKQCVSSFNDCSYSEAPRKRKRRALPLERLQGLESRLEAVESSASKNATSSSAGHDASQDLTTATQEDAVSVNINKPSTAYHSIDNGEVEFQANSGDKYFMESFREKLTDWPDSTTAHEHLTPNVSVPDFFSVDAQAAADVVLPARSWAAKLTEAALDAQALMSVVHRPSFHTSFDLIYALNGSDYSAREKKFLPLLYSVLAYGCLFVESDTETLDRNVMIAQGAKFFAKSQQLQEVATCKDITSLQSLVFLNFFLLSVSRKFYCYTYLAATMSVAVRMGLHRSLRDNQDFISKEVGKRLFWTLWMLLNEISVCGGMPRFPNDNEIDQELPTEVSDSNIRQAQILFMPLGEICDMAGANAYRRLYTIRHDAVQQIFPIRAGGRYGSPASNVEIIRDVEKDLDAWVEALPYGYRLGTHFATKRLTRDQFLLAISFAYVQMYLYRPFLHCVVKPPLDQRSLPKDALAYSATSVLASQNVVLLFEDMFERGLLNSAILSVPSLLFGSVLTIFYTLLQSRGSPEADTLIRSLAMGRRILDHVASLSYPAHRCKVILTVLISTLPEELQHVRDKLLDPNADIARTTRDESYQQRSSPADAYTTQLAGEVFSLTSKSSTVDGICSLLVNERKASDIQADPRTGQDNVEGSRPPRRVSSRNNARPGGPSHSGSATLSVRDTRQPKRGANGVSNPKMLDESPIPTLASTSETADELMQSQPSGFGQEPLWRLGAQPADIGMSKQLGVGEQFDIDFLDPDKIDLQDMNRFFDFQNWF